MSHAAVSGQSYNIDAARFERLRRLGASALIEIFLQRRAGMRKRLGQAHHRNIGLCVNIDFGEEIVQIGSVFESEIVEG